MSSHSQRSSLQALLIVFAAAPVFGQGIVINEIMFHPLQPEFGPEPVTEEYIELFNAGTNLVDLSGWRLDRSVRFTFPAIAVEAQGYVVVAANIESFGARHAGVSNVVGGWQGTLSNNGEEIRLVDAASNTVDWVQYATEGDWAIRQRGLLDSNHRGWKWGAPADGGGLSLQRRNPEGHRNNGQNWLAAFPTPGAVNRGFTNDLAPLIADVAHSPLIPRSTQTVAITARLTDDAPATITASVFYRADSLQPPSFTSAPMFDDGQHGDGVTDDGIYGAILPAHPNNTVVEFFVEAVDGRGLTNCWPAPPVPAADETNLPPRVPLALYQVDDQTFAGGEPLYKFIMIETERAELASIPCTSDQNSNAEMNGTFLSVEAAGTECRYLCGIRNRGHHSRCTTPPNYRVNFATDRLWKGQRALNINAERSYLHVFGSALARKSGLPGFDSRAVQVRVNNVNLAPPGGTMFGRYSANEVYNNTWSERHLSQDGDGNLYRVLRDLYPWAFTWRGEAPEAYTNTYFKASNASENDWSDLVQLHRIVGASDSFTTENVRSVVNVEEWMLYLSVMALMADAGTCLNTGVNDDYVLYRGVQDPRFILLYYDLGSILGYLDIPLNETTTTWDIFRSTSDCWECGSGEMMSRFIHWPDFQPIYFATLQRLLDTTFSEAEFNALVDQIFASYPQTSLVTTMQANLKSWMNDRRSFVQVVIEGQVSPPEITPLATVSGEPRSLTPFSTALLAVGGDDITFYRYRLNSGPWSPDRTVATPIQLTGLPHHSTNTVHVLGRNSAGTLQDEGFPTASRMWVVDTNTPTVRLNEVLACNELAVNQAGLFPDLIELYNEGTASVELTGLRLTDDPTDPNRFVFPEGVVLGAGDYLVLYADASEVAPGFHLGFALNQQGDGVYLFDRATRDGVLLDSVAFGLQLPDRSLGRVGRSADWMLTWPTFGGTNAACLLGTQAGLKVNEWLASDAPPFVVDYLELYNSDPLPVALDGLLLSDQPFGAPARHPVAPLSYIDGRGHSVFIADGETGAGADHLGFRLSSEVGEISLKARGGAPLDLVVYGPQRPGVAQGRCPDGAPKITSLTLPTPGYANFCPGLPPQPILVNLVQVNQEWRYTQDGAYPGLDWATSEFDDSGWSNGPGVLGKLRDDPNARLPETILTPLGVGSALTYYFRTHFTLPPGARFASLQISNLIDDGAVFYVNGVELPTRFQMSSGSVTSTTMASLSASDATWQGPIVVASSRVHEGDNVLAVEVHQFRVTSTDVMFGLRLDGVFTTSTAQDAGVVINEVLANNTIFADAGGATPDWVELFNPSTNTVDLGDMSLSDSPDNPRRWVFPSPTILAPRSFFVVRFDPDALPSATNAGFGLKTSGDSVYLFSSPVYGSNILDVVNFGLQTADFSIGRSPDGQTNWSLTVPSIGGSNVIASLGEAGRLRINEWMALPSSGDDWFELYNPDPQPVALGGLWFSDDLASSTERMKSRVPPLSFIGCVTNAYQRFHADKHTALGADHVSFKLNGTDGDSLGLSYADGTLIHGVRFGAQPLDVSEGMLPDGRTNQVHFFGSVSPSEANYLVLPHVVINEVLAHSNLPLEDALELRNLSTEPVDLGGWYLSDSKENLRKFCIPPGTVLPAGGFRVFYEWQFNDLDRPATAFAFSSAHGDQAYLSQAALGELTGWRAEVRFGPSENGVSFGRYETSTGAEFVAMSGLSFGTFVTAESPTNQAAIFRTGLGASNPYPKIGPVIISEIMYRPPDTVLGGVFADNGVEEFIELRNIIANPVPLCDPASPTNGWRLRDAVGFQFNASHVIPPGGHLLVVSFDPQTNLAALATFGARYGSNCTLAGPYTGKLDNSSDSVELVKPGRLEPDGSVPWVLVEKVVYHDHAPWPTNADGGGASLQRVSETGYANDPANWVAAAPAPGPASLPDGDGDGMPDDWELAHGLDSQEAADAAQDPDQDGLSNLQEFLCGTDPRDPQSYLRIEGIGSAEGCVWLQIVAVAGRSYTILCRDAAEAGPWYRLLDVDPQPFTQTLTVMDPSPAAATQRFYRLVSPAAH